MEPRRNEEHEGESGKGRAGARAMRGANPPFSLSPHLPSFPSLRVLRGKNSSSGFSLLELIITLSILSILVAAVVPLTKQNLKRQREAELKQTLREMRQAIDRYKFDCERGAVGQLDRKVNDECYPPDIATLVDGITPPNTTRKIRYLRRTPRDPLTGSEEWGVRSIQDDPKSDSGGGGQNVFDVFSKSNDTALNGTKYKDW